MGNETVKLGGMDIEHNYVPWGIFIAKDKNADGTLWGWIRGTPEPVFWSDDSAFTHEKAKEAVTRHNEWLEAKEPIDLRISKVVEVVQKAKKKYDEKRRELSRYQYFIDQAVKELNRLKEEKDENT